LNLVELSSTNSLGQNKFKNLTYNEGSPNIGGIAIQHHLF